MGCHFLNKNATFEYMEDSEIYKNREKLYEPLVQSLGLRKVEDKYYPEMFGNFFITLSSKIFSLRYIMERSYLTIEIKSNFAGDKWYDLSFIKNFINKADKINQEDNLDNLTRIKELNGFLKTHFTLVNELLSQDNYHKTYDQLEVLLNNELRLRYPGMIEE